MIGEDEIDRISLISKLQVLYSHCYVDFLSRIGIRKGIQQCVLCRGTNM